MKITKKFDRAFRRAGEKMGAESRTTTHSDEFKNLEAEMGLRMEGMERLHRTMNAYVKWTQLREEIAGDREKAMPGSHVGRTMVIHGEDFEESSDFGNSLIAVGRANERLASLQEQYAADITSSWLESLTRNLAMMKEYQCARKKLESRRLAYDTATSKARKSKREDFRLEEDARSSKAKFEEANDDVYRRMQDIKEAETDNLGELTSFLNAQLDYHERCAEELRRARADLNGIAPLRAESVHSSASNPPRSRVARQSYSYVERSHPQEHIYQEEYEPEPEPERPRLMSRRSTRRPAPDIPCRPAAPSRSVSTASSATPSYASSTYSVASSGLERRPRQENGPSMLERRASVQQQQMAINPASLRSQLRPVGRIGTESAPAVSRPGYHRGEEEDVFAHYEDASSDSAGSSGWGAAQERCVSPATSVSSWGRSAGSYRKAPPPPPPSRAKKPAPPVPPKREMY